MDQNTINCINKNYGTSNVYTCCNNLTSSEKTKCINYLNNNINNNITLSSIENLQYASNVGGL